MTQGECPPDSTYNNSVGGRYTKTANHLGCEIVVTMRSGAPVSTKVRDKILEFVPADSTGTPVTDLSSGAAMNSIANWVCLGDGEGTSADMEVKYLPSGCRP
jgi:hypothetical protein